MWLMPAEPAPADPGWDEDPARVDGGPVSAEDGEAWLDRVCERDGGPFYAPVPGPARHLHQPGLP